MSIDKKTRKRKSSNKREIYIAFSGGGAKAFIHVGALNFLEKNFRIRGVAGTSAGALIAVLKAAGFTSDDMFIPKNKSGQSKIFDKIKDKDESVEKISHLLGGEGLDGIKHICSSPLVYIAKRARLLQKIFLIFTFALIALAIPIYLSQRIKPEGALEGFMLTALLIVAFIIAWFYAVAWPTILHISDHIFENGIASTKKAIDEIERQVAQKLGIQNRPVLMGDFELPIRIIAANIDRQKAKIFSNSGTPQTPLHDALSASICIPVAFKPHLYKGERYIDGGVVSNLPAFVFSEEISLHPKRRVIALRITETDEKKKKSGFFRRSFNLFVKKSLRMDSDAGLYSSLTFKNIVDTLFRGAQDLAHNNMDVVAADLPTSLRILDFDLNYNNMGKAYAQGQAFANKLVTQSFDAEDEHNRSCKLIADYVENSLNQISFLKRREGGLVRVAVAYVPFEGSSAIRIKYGHGFESSSDRDVLLPLDSSICGKAWMSQQVIFEPRQSQIKSDLVNYRHISSRIDKDLQWILSIPILDKNRIKTRFVINIDSNTKILDSIRQNPSIAEDIPNMLRNFVDFSTFIGSQMLDTLDSIEEKV